MEFIGKIIAILPIKSGVSKTTGNEWKAQEYVIENHDQYPRRMCFEVFGADKISAFNIQMGEELSVSYDMDARQWRDRWFNSIRAWAVNRLTNNNNAATQSAAVAAAPTGAPFSPEQAAQNGGDPFASNTAEGNGEGSADDLPF